jgi:hypothetical protein
LQIRRTEVTNLKTYTGKIIVTAVVFATLSACSQAVPDPVQPITIKTQPVDRPSLNLPAVDRYKARPVDWVVITPENVDEVFENLKASGQPVVVFGVPERGYENIALNTNEALRVIIQQQAVIAGYESYYIKVDGVIYEYNRSIQ